MPKPGRLMLHIGLPKTGSSAIQAYLAANRLDLGDRGVRWSGATRVSHAQLPSAFTARPNRVSESVGVRTLRDQAALRRRLHARLAEELRRWPAVLISTEHLTAMLGTDAEVGVFAEFCRSLTPDVEAVAVLRRGDHWLPSSYAEAVLGGTRRRFDAGFVDFRAPLLDHVAILQRWSDALGPDAVRAVPMLEDDREDPAALPTRVLDAFGIQGRDWSVPARTARVGLSEEGTQMLQAITPLLPAGGLRPGRERERLREALRERFPGHSVRLSPAAAGELQRRGLVQTGVDELPMAVGEGWTNWRRAPLAEVRDLPVVAEDRARDVLAELQSDGVVRSHDARWALAARRAAITLLR